MFSQGNWGLRQKGAPSSASISMIYLLNTDNIPLDSGFSFVASVNSMSAAVGSRLAGNGHRCWLRKDSSAGRLPAAVPSGTALMFRASLKLPDLFTFQNYWWLAIFLQLICWYFLLLQTTRTNDRRSHVQPGYAYGSESVSTSLSLRNWNLQRRPPGKSWNAPQRTSCAWPSFFFIYLFFALFLSLNVQSHCTLALP